MNLQLRKFKPEGMADDKVCVFIGKRNTGKSTLVTDILYHKKHLPAGIVLSATEEGNHYYQQYIPDLFIYTEITTEKLLNELWKDRGNLLEQVNRIVERFYFWTIVCMIQNL